MTIPATEQSGAPLAADDQGNVTLSLRINGRTEHVRARTHHTLLQVLRDQLHLYSVREGCGVGMCGACTVLVDGKPVSGCLMLAPMAEGSELTTVEGLEGPAGELDDVQQAFVANTGFQCSYCTPGFILATKALLAENAAASEEEIRGYLAGNLCRCGSYVKIMNAVLEARDRRSDRAVRVDEGNDPA